MDRLKRFKDEAWINGNPLEIKKEHNYIYIKYNKSYSKYHYFVNLDERDKIYDVLMDIYMSENEPPYSDYDKRQKELFKYIQKRTKENLEHHWYM